MASWRSTSASRSSGKSMTSSFDKSSIVRLRSRTRSMMRAKRFDVEKTKVPQAEIKTAGVIIALRMFNAFKARVNSSMLIQQLFESIDACGQFEIPLRQPTLIVRRHAEPDVVPAVKQNVGM